MLTCIIDISQLVSATLHVLIVCEWIPTNNEMTGTFRLFFCGSQMWSLFILRKTSDFLMLTLLQELVADRQKEWQTDRQTDVSISLGHCRTTARMSAVCYYDLVEWLASHRHLSSRRSVGSRQLRMTMDCGTIYCHHHSAAPCNCHNCPRSVCWTQLHLSA